MKFTLIVHLLFALKDCISFTAKRKRPPVSKNKKQTNKTKKKKIWINHHDMIKQTTWITALPQLWSFSPTTNYNIFQLSVVKPKPFELLWPIATDISNKMNQSEYEANTCGTRQVREARGTKTPLVSVLLPIIWENGASFLPIAMCFKANALLLLTQLKARYLV